MNKYYVSIEKSIERILSTPIGSRVMRPEYGSNLFELIDRKYDEEWKLDAIRFTYTALDRWEKRIEVLKIDIEIKNERVNILINYRDRKSGEDGQASYST